MLAQNLKVIDLPAAAFCMENNIPSKLFALYEDKSIIRVVQGEEIGTTLS